MSYQVELTESFFPAQAEGIVRDLTLGEQLRKTARRHPAEIGLVEVDIDGNIGCSWTYSELLTEGDNLALVLAGRIRPRYPRV